VQDHPIKPTLKAPGTKLLKLKYGRPLSKVGFKFNLRRYTLEWRQAMVYKLWCARASAVLAVKTAAQGAADVAAIATTVRRCRLTLSNPC
jgi:hypothetical protein